MFSKNRKFEKRKREKFRNRRRYQNFATHLTGADDTQISALFSKLIHRPFCPSEYRYFSGDAFPPFILLFVGYCIC